MKSILSAPFAFSAYQLEDYISEIESGIALNKEEIKAIKENPEAPNFNNTIAALDRSGQHLAKFSSAFFNLNASNTNEKWQEAAQQIAPKLSNFSNDIILDQELFERIQSVYNTEALAGEAQMLLEKTFKKFTNNGALLRDDQKEELRKVDEKLSMLSVKFGSNVLADSNAYELHIQEEAKLEGLPQSAIDAAKLTAEQREKEGFVFTLDYPSYLPFMRYCKDRNLRKELNMAFGQKGFQQNEYNNEKTVKEIVELRAQRAKILGFETYADFILDERMANTPKTVFDFIDELYKKALPAAGRELKELKEFAAAREGIEDLKKWDVAYFSEQLKAEKFDIDREKLRVYFSLDRVLDGVFDICNRLFELEFKPLTDVEVYHPEVRIFEVADKKGEPLAYLYTDFHPRASKRNGAWMTSYRSQFIKEGQNHRPHVSIVCNFSKATETQPALLQFEEVLTLFHEFGHALHGILANTEYSSLSGTSVSWDFVELPSQLFENWCYQEEALNLFAKHFETDEVISIEDIRKLKQAANFQEGMATLRQLSFASLDMAWHTTSIDSVTSVKAFETAKMQAFELLEATEETCMSTAFSHIFQGGYAAGYYSYKWAEVLDADAFEYFEEKGIFDTQIAAKLKDFILSKGGTEDPMELYTKFRGRKPKVDALLKRAGLV